MNHATSSTTSTEQSFPNSGTTNKDAGMLGRTKIPLRSLVRPITPEDLKALCNTVSTPRDMALLLILIQSGLRVGEITGLDRSTIQLFVSTSADGSKLTLGKGEVVLSKQASFRSFWLDSDSVTAVAEYLAKDRTEDTEPALFVTQRGKRITREAVRAAVARWCRTAEIEPITCHRFRHTLALQLLNAGVSRHEMAKRLGYSKPKGAI